jgi:putative PIN family toxin of toxin-antitoxin system
MIVVLDTNVIISAFVSPSGPPAAIIDHWESDGFEVVTSRPLLEELERVLQYSRVQKYLTKSPREINRIVNRFKTAATVVEPQEKLTVIEQDPDDNRVLECAVAGMASYIISGNEHLLRIKKFSGIVILKPATFLTLISLE